MVVVGEDVIKPVIQGLDDVELEERVNELEKQIRELKDAIFGLLVSNSHQIENKMCRGGDLNPRPPDYESGAPTS